MTKITKESLQSLIPSSWSMLLQTEMNEDYWDTIVDKLNEGTFYPSKNNIFAALRDITPDNVKVILLGQDPYHTDGAAHGYSFSTRKGYDIQPSLKNIFKELSMEYDKKIDPEYGDLTKWEKEGVLLLNRVLTVKPHEPNSHCGIGWERFTEAILKYFANKHKVVYLLLGAKAKEAIRSIDVPPNRVVYAGHPSPLNTSGSFIGSDCFKKVNEVLMSMNVLPIRWHIVA